MNQIFRCILDFQKDGKSTISKQDLINNYETFKSSSIITEDPSSLTLFTWIEGHYRDFGTLPGINLIINKAEAAGNEGILAMVKDITLERPFIGNDYKSILNEKCKSNKLENLQQAIQKTWEAANTGIDVGFGKRKTKIVGIDAAIDFFIDKTLPLRTSVIGDQTGIIEPNSSQLLETGSLEGAIFIPHAIYGREYCYRKGSLNFIAGGTGSGKSTRMLYECANHTASGQNGLFFTLEMTAEDVYRNFFITLHNNGYFQNEKVQILSSRKLESNAFDKKEKEIFKNINNYPNLGKFRVCYIPKLSASIIQTTALNFANILAKEGRSLDYIYVDYAGLMAPDALSITKSGQNEYLSQVIRELKILALTLRVPLVSAYQINREAMRAASADTKAELKRPRLYHLAWASEVERSADSVTFLHPTGNNGNTRNYEIIIGKSRKGKDGKVYFSSIDLDTKRWDDSNGVCEYDTHEVQTIDLTPTNCPAEMSGPEVAYEQ